MTGLREKFQITRQGYEEDDEIGGAVYTGTVIQTVWGRLQPLSRSMMSLEQGIEAGSNFSLELPNKAQVTENDIVTLVFPKSHEFYQTRFLVTSVQSTSMRDSRAFKRLVIRRVERGRSKI